MSTQIYDLIGVVSTSNTKTTLDNCSLLTGVSVFPELFTLSMTHLSCSALLLVIAACQGRS
jgi:hypothetical protein